MSSLGLRKFLAAMLTSHGFVNTWGFNGYCGYMSFLGLCTSSVVMLVPCGYVKSYKLPMAM